MITPHIGIASLSEARQNSIELPQSKTKHYAPQVRSCYWCVRVQWHNNADDKDSDATMICSYSSNHPWTVGKNFREKSVGEEAIQKWSENISEGAVFIFTYFHVIFHKFLDCCTTKLIVKVYKRRGVESPKLSIFCQCA